MKIKPTHKSMGIHHPPEGPFLKVSQVDEESRRNQPVPDPIPPKHILKVGEGPRPPKDAQELDNEHMGKLVLGPGLNVGVSKQNAVKARELKLNLTKLTNQHGGKS